MEALEFSDKLLRTPSGKHVPFRGSVQQTDTAVFATDGGDGPVVVRARTAVEEWLRLRY